MTQVRGLREVPESVVDPASGERILVGEYLYDGRDGAIFKGKFRGSPTDDLAIKFFLRKRSNTLFRGRTRAAEFAMDLKDTSESELKRLSSLAHPNVQQYITKGAIKYKKGYFKSFNPDVDDAEEIPFLVSRLVPGTNLEAIFSNKDPIKPHRITRWLYDVSLALAYVHRQDVLHNDVATRNIVISQVSDRATLVDFGISKYLPSADTTYTRLWIDSEPLPQFIKNAISQKVDGKWQRQELRELLFPAVDLYNFAVVIDACLQKLDREQIADSEYEYLALIRDDLRKWEESKALQGRPSQSKSMLRTADDLVKVFERLIAGADFYRQKLSEGSAGPKHFNRPAVAVEIREGVGRVLEHPMVTRLQNLSQLSMLHRVYPSANQSRLDHALCALGRAQQVWKALASRPRFRLLVEPKDVHRLELVALLHDLNHFPFLHYFQEAGITSVETAKVLDVLLKSDYSSPEIALGTLLEKEGLSSEFLSKVIHGDAGQEARPVDDIIVSVVNSGVDVDKMAYLYDDALHTGVPYGLGVDSERLIQEIDVAYVEGRHFHEDKRGRWHIVFHQSALSAVESLCWARYWNFQRIYWHPRNRAVAAMIIWVVRELFAKGKETFASYLVSTLGGGELGALDYLDRQFMSHYGRPSPLFGLSVDSTKIFAPILEIPKTSIPELTRKGVEDERRLAVQDKVAGEIHDYVDKNAVKKLKLEPQPGEVLLDIPLRPLGLGGSIFVLDRKGQACPVTTLSPAVEDLKQGFAEMSSTVRVFVSPRIRDAVGTRRWREDEETLTSRVIAAAKEAAVPKKEKGEAV